MTRKTDENKLINRYLLGELSDDELAQVEERYFADEDFFEDILEAENSLVDSYARGNLSAAEHGRFERQFLTTPQRRQKVKFAQSLKKAVADSQSAAAATNATTARQEPRAIVYQETSWWQSLAGIFKIQGPALALGMGAVLLMFFGIWQISELGRSNSDLAKQILLTNDQQSNIDENVRTTNEAADTNTSPQKPVNTQTEQQSSGVKSRNEKQTGERIARPEKQIDNPNAGSEKSNPPPQRQPVVATTLLIPGLLRSEGKRIQIAISAKANQIPLQLSLEENEYSRYRVTIENPDGEEIWSGRVRKAKKGDKTVPFLVPAKPLSKGDYRLILKGETAEGEAETISEYPFSVIKK